MTYSAGIFSGHEDSLTNEERPHAAADVLDVAGRIRARNVGKVRESKLGKIISCEARWSIVPKNVGPFTINMLCNILQPD